MLFCPERSQMDAGWLAGGNNRLLTASFTGFSFNKWTGEAPFNLLSTGAAAVVVPVAVAAVAAAAAGVAAGSVPLMSAALPISFHCGVGAPLSTASAVASRKPSVDYVPLIGVLIESGFFLL